VSSSPVAETPFERVYRTLAPAVVSYLRAHGIDDPEAVSQDVFIAVLPRIGGIRGGEDGVRTLIFSIAHARAVDHHRARARKPPTVVFEPAKDSRAVASAEELAVTRSGDDDILSILSLLSEDHREVLLLRVLADMPLERVATVMGKSVGAVKQLQRRALLALKDRPELERWRTR
jgi:RNA polymerase sigma-70 factor (ECF subfamily)